MIHGMIPFLASKVIPNNKFYWLTGYDTGRAIKYDSSFAYTETFIDLQKATTGYTTIPFRCRDITKGSNGHWYITENNNKRIYEYDANWNYVAYYVVNVQENNPSGLHQGLDGKWYLIGLDPTAVGVNPSVVWVYNADWTYSGTSYDLSAQLQYGTALWQMSDGKWFVLEKEWVYEYSSTFVYSGTRHGLRFGSPVVHGLNGYGICRDSDGNWYVVDINDDAVNKYSSSWTYLASYSTLSEDGVMSGIYLSTQSTNIPENVIFVKSDATGANNGTSWSNAYTSFQSALNSAVSGKEIWVAKGTYETSYDYGLGIGATGNHFRLKSGVSIYGGFAGTELKVSQRSAVSNETILSGSVSGSYHVFNHTNLGLTNSAILDGFAVSGGRAVGTSPHSNGGGMLNSGTSLANGSSPTIRYCTFKNNYATDTGGGIYNSQYCSPVVSYCTFDTNSAELRGGGIYNNRNASTISNCTFNANSIVQNSNVNYGGAGIYNTLSVVTETCAITDCLFTNNTIATGTYGFGAGIYNYSNPGTVNISRCTFYQNSSKYAPGIYNRSASLTNVVSIDSCYFHKNTATYGGGMMNESAGTIIKNCTFKKNEAVSPGQCGGLYMRGFATTVINCLFTGNKAYNYGGATYTNSIASTFINCTMAGNYASRGGGSACITGATLAFQNCIIYNNIGSVNGNVVHADASTITFDYGSYRNDAGDVYTTAGGTFTATNSITTDPQFINPIVPTDVNTPNDLGDYMLPYASPCLDAGNDAYISEAYDIRGTPHSRKLSKEGGVGTVDMGAYEYSVA